MFGEYRNVSIAGVAAAAPKRTINNMDFVNMFESRRAKRQVKLTGIDCRHVCDKGQQASVLATVAARELLAKLRWDKDDVRVLVFVTQSPEVDTPATAMLIQKRLGIGTDCIAFDVNLGCSGYVSGLQIVSALLQSTKGKALLLVGDGRYYDLPEKPTTDSLLFGDGAAATALEYREGSKGLVYSQNTDGSRWQLLTKSLGGPVYMDGNAILLFSLEEASKSIRETREHFGIREEDIDYYVLHQAQKIILDGMAEECNIPKEKILISYDEYGNTSTATVPITICRNADLIKGQRKSLMLSGFGIGLAWANVFITVETEHIFPVILTDEVF